MQSLGNYRECHQTPGGPQKQQEIERSGCAVLPGSDGAEGTWDNIRSTTSQS